MESGANPWKVKAGIRWRSSKQVAHMEWWGHKKVPVEDEASEECQSDEERSWMTASGCWLCRESGRCRVRVVHPACALLQTEFSSAWDHGAFFSLLRDENLVADGTNDTRADCPFFSFGGETAPGLRIDSLGFVSCH